MRKAGQRFLCPALSISHCFLSCIPMCPASDAVFCFPLDMFTVLMTVMHGSAPYWPPKKLPSLPLPQPCLRDQLYSLCLSTISTPINSALLTLWKNKVFVIIAQSIKLIIPKS